MFPAVEPGDIFFHCKNLVVDQNLRADFQAVLISIKCKGLALFYVGGSCGGGGDTAALANRGGLRSVRVANREQAENPRCRDI